MVNKNPVVLCCLLLLFGQAVADDSNRHLQVDGMSVYLGVIPAQLTQQHPEMHGGGADKEHRYHLLIALLDSSSSERITDAQLKATVSLLGLAGSTKSLEPMHGAQSIMSYGNYFTMPKPELYRIRVEIRRGDSKHLSVANFVFQRPRD